MVVRLLDCYVGAASGASVRAMPSMRPRPQPLAVGKRYPLRPTPRWGGQPPSWEPVEAHFESNEEAISIKSGTRDRRVTLEIESATTFVAMTLDPAVAFKITAQGISSGS